jgi:tetratricopeptide (TPR) repeat protein
MQRKYGDAVKCFAKVLELDPKYPGARRKMGAALLVSGKTDEAITHFNEALRMNADRAEVYANLGTAYNQLGKYELAIQNWNKSIEIEPNNANVLNDMAWLLATTSDVSVRDTDRAIDLAKRACELTNYKNPGILDTLAAAFASDGRFSQAVEITEKALELCQSSEQNLLKKEIENHLVLYKAGKPYIGTQ